MRIRPKLKNSFSEDKQCVKTTQFKYQQGLRNSRRKQQSHKIITDDSPLKILLKKMSMASQTNPNAKSKSLKQQQQAGKFTQDLIQHIAADYKKFIVPRDALYQPNRSVFNRFNYQNYNNYSYKNPFKPKKYPIDDKMEHPLKNIPHLGSNKNLQIVFCQHKYKDFVQKTNSQLKQFAQTARNFQTQKTLSHKKVQSHISRYQSEPKIPSKTMYNTRRRTTTLSNYLQQFATLEKLSDYMEREHKINERYLLHAAYDKSRTVLLDILVHRFQFLKKMKKKCRDAIFLAIFGPESLDPLFKIHIQEYIKFIQVFVSRDADPSFLALLMFKFLFKDENSINEQTVLKSLDLIGNSANKHSIIESKIFSIMEANMNRSDKIFQEFRADQNLQNLFIDLIVQ